MITIVGVLSCFLYFSRLFIITDGKQAVPTFIVVHCSSFNKRYVPIYKRRLSSSSLAFAVESRLVFFAVIHSLTSASSWGSIKLCFIYIQRFQNSAATGNFMKEIFPLLYPVLFLSKHLQCVHFLCMHAGIYDRADLRNCHLKWSKVGEMKSKQIKEKRGENVSKIFFWCSCIWTSVFPPFHMAELKCKKTNT